MYSLVFRSRNLKATKHFGKPENSSLGSQKPKIWLKKKTELEKAETYTVVSSKNSHQTPPFDMKYTRKESKRNIKNSSRF